MEKSKVTRCLDNQVKEKEVIYPKTVEEIRQTIAYCNENKISFYPVSSGNNWGYGSSFPTNDHTPIIMNLSRMPSVIAFDEKDGLLTFGPGLTQQKLYEFLEANNHAFMVPVTGAGPNANIMGNALERGFGITPIHDHVESVIAIKAVLPDGSNYESSFAQLGLSTLDKRYKWAVGPNFDYIFFQSNFGVVYEMTIKLEKIPESILMFNISIDQNELSDCLEIFKALKATYKGFLSGVNFMNSRRMLAMKTSYLKEEKGFINDEKIKSLQKQHKLSDWTIVGAIYGPKDIAARIKRAIKKSLSGIGTNKQYLSSNSILFSIPSVGNFLIGKEQFLLLKEAFAILKGKPSLLPLNLIYSKKDVKENDKKYNPIKDNVGIIWYAPVIPIHVDIIERYHDFLTEKFKKFAMEPILTFTLQNENIAAVTMPLLFDKTDNKETENAHALYKTLLKETLNYNAYPYRIPSIFQKEYLEKLDTKNSLTIKLKKQIDPNNILAPNRYSKI